MLAVCLYSCVGIACRYSVRDLGFVDLGEESYTLYGYIGGNTPEEIATTFATVSRGALLDSNIAVELIDTGKQGDHPAMDQLRLQPGRPLPAAVLVSPDGRSLDVPLAETGRPFEESCRSALDGLVSSPTRDEILERIGEGYGVALLIEGADPLKNKAAREEISKAVQGIARRMKYMPKPIAHPPAVVVVRREARSREKVLLWCLGKSPDGADAPSAAVLYGRMRWIGPLMKGEEITELNVSRILEVIGEDCECGLDVSWTRGTVLPGRWDEGMRTRVAEALGFDPEHPVVKMEASAIVSMNRVVGKDLRTPGLSGDVPFGYQELVMEFESDSEGRPVSAGNSGEVATTPWSPATSAGSSSTATVRHTLFHPAILVAIGFCIVVVISGTGILLWKRRR